MTPAQLDRARQRDALSPYQRCQLQLCRCSYCSGARLCQCTATVSVHDLRAVLEAMHHATCTASTLDDINAAFGIAMTPDGDG